MSRKPPGQPGKIISWFRSFLVGRPIEKTPWLRSPHVVSSRSPPPPNLPPGPAHRLATNYYCSRDLRREVQPPTVVGTHAQLAEASETLSSEEVVFPQITTPPTPGIGHKWAWKQS